MGAMVLPEVLTRQPTIQLPIDAAKPLAQQLLSFRNGALAAYGLTGLHGRAMARVSSQGYVNPDIAPNTNATNGTLTGRDQITLVALVRRTSANTGNNQFAIRYRDPGNTNGTGALSLGVTAFANNGTIRLVTPGGNISFVTTNATAVPDTLHIVGTWDRIAQTANLYLNGNLVATSSSLTTAAIPTGSYTMFDCDADSGSVNTGFCPYYTMVYGRIVQPGEVRALQANAYQVLRAPSRWLLSTAAAAPLVYVLAADSGGFALSGSAAGVRAARRLPAAQGAFAIAAGGTSIVAARRLSAASAAFSLSGSAPLLLATRVLPTNSGVFALTAPAALLRSLRRMAAQSGAFALSPGGAQMVYAPVQGPVGPTYVLGVAAGVFSMAGGLAQLRASRLLHTEANAFALDGAITQLRVARRLPADTASYAMTGSATVLRYSGSAGPIDISKISPTRIVIFEGSGSRVVQFEGSGSRVVQFEGSGSRIVVFEGSGSKTVRFE